MEPNRLNDETDGGLPIAVWCRRGMWRFVGAAVGLAMIVGPAAAQAQQLLPPENKEGIKGKAWISGAVLLLVLAMVAFAAFMKTKRTHED